MILLESFIQVGKFISTGSGGDSYLSKLSIGLISAVVAVGLYFLKKWHDDSKEEKKSNKSKGNDMIYFFSIYDVIVVDIGRIRSFTKGFIEWKNSRFTSIWTKHKLYLQVIQN